MPPTAEAERTELALADVVELLEAEQTAISVAAKTDTNGKVHGTNLRSYTDDERAKLKQIVGALSSGDETRIRAAHAALELDKEGTDVTPAQELATATEPDRPEGAADDETPESQAAREAGADWNFEDPDPVKPPEPASTEPVPDPEPPDDVPAEPDPTAAAAAELNDPATVKRMQDAAGITDDRAEARGEPDPEPEPNDGALFEPEPDEYDVEVWQAIIGGEQPTDRKIKIVASKAAITGDPAGGIKKGGVYEIRATVRAQGYRSDDKYKVVEGAEELIETVEQRELHVIDAMFVDDPEPGDRRALVEAAVRHGMTLRKNANDDTVAAAVEELIG